MILEQPTNDFKLVGAGLKPAPTHNIYRSWTDEFGSLIATLEGRSGGESLMVMVTLEQADIALQTLQNFSSFKGRIFLVILEHLHAAPIEAVLNANNPNLVVALENACTGIATRGSEITLETAEITTSTGLTYFESGKYNSWNNKTLESQLQTKLSQPSIAASVATNLKIPCAVCNLEHLKTLLETLLV